VRGRAYRLVVGGGKGGVGKTTVALHLALSLAALPGGARVRYVDGDVEEPDGGLFLRPEIDATRPVLRPVPEIDRGRCDACGACARACAYGALLFFGADPPALQGALCAGCGACAWACPRGAIREVPVPLGEIREGRARGLAFSEGILRVGEARSARLGAALADSLPGGEIQVIDGPPGTACSVRVLYARADRVLLVAEPTPFGEADLRRGWALARLLGRPTAVFLNRDDRRGPLRERLRAEGIPLWGELPDSPEMGRALSRGELLGDRFPEAREAFRALALRVRAEAESGAEAGERKEADGPCGS
jgi:MinD superfamily P-loop ATPase